MLGTPYETGLSGRLDIAEGGELILNERHYEVERAIVRFLDERRILPSLDLVMNTSARPYEVTISASGTPDDLETTLTATPTLPEPDIMALLVTGRTLDEMRGEEFEVAKSQVLSYLSGRVASQLGRGLERATGLSTVRVEPTLDRQRSRSERAPHGRSGPDAGPQPDLLVRPRQRRQRAVGC